MDQTFFDLSFFQDILANLLATLAGLLLGIPIALEINRRQESRRSKLDVKRKENEAAERKSKILHLLAGELEHNMSELRTRRDRTKVPAGRDLKVELWRALSDGGELQWITDLELINVLADAYYYIQQTKIKEAYRNQVYYSVEATDLRSHHLEMMSIEIVGVANQTEQIVSRALESMRGHMDHKPNQ